MRAPTATTDWTRTPARVACALVMLVATCGVAVAVAPQRQVAMSGASELPTRTIDLNSALPAELELLPGIGPALAKRIVTFRAEHGGFNALKNLDAVPGIGPRTLKDLAPFARFSAPEAASDR